MTWQRQYTRKYAPGSKVTYFDRQGKRHVKYTVPPTYIENPNFGNNPTGYLYTRLFKGHTQSAV